ncbi:MAG: hypothetical protein LBL31_03235 [Spirochaetaceae bacterium]|jgi:hypothetical protein|nr:hypothetical protein [Spirochaetaceae bacterium]
MRRAIACLSSLVFYDIAERAKGDKRIEQLETVPGAGLMTAFPFLLCLELLVFAGILLKRAEKKPIQCHYFAGASEIGKFLF